MININSYSKKVLEHFRNPHNFGKLKNPSAVGEVGNVVCGDVMFLYIKVGKDKKNHEIILQFLFSFHSFHFFHACLVYLLRDDKDDAVLYEMFIKNKKSLIEEITKK